MKQTIGFIGSGHMTSAIIGGLVADSGMAADAENKPNILVSNRGQDKLAALCKKYQVQAAVSNEEVVSSCTTVVLGVKPQLLEQVVTPLAPLFQQHKPSVISVAAGIRCTTLGNWLGSDIPLVRAMPNVASVIGEGATGLFANQGVDAQQRAVAEKIFKSVGLVCWLAEEDDINKVTAISGSGPAYFMLMIQGLVEAAVDAGMSADIAQQLAVQTARGTAGMISQSDKSLQQMLDDMLLPGGTTEQAVAALNQQGLPATMKAAFNAANLRAQQLADELSK